MWLPSQGSHRGVTIWGGGIVLAGQRGYCKLLLHCVAWPSDGGENLAPVQQGWAEDQQTHPQFCIQGPGT